MVNVFTRSITDDLASLVKQLDDVVGKNKSQKMAGFVVVLGDEEELKPKLEALAKKHGIKNIPLTVYEGEAGPRNYKISKDADLTVMMWVGRKKSVKVNHALASGKLDAKATKQIVADTAKILK